MSIHEIRPHLYRLVLGRYQAYLWADAEGTTLIDTGEPGSMPMIADALREIDLDLPAVDRIVLTHFHDDHVGAAADVVARSGAEVIAHRNDVPVIQGEASGPPPNLSEFEKELHAQVAAGLQPAPPVRVDRPVGGGDVLEFAGGAHVIPTPGHTNGSIALHLPTHGVILTGDIAAEHAGEVMLGVFNLDTTEAAASFRRLADLDVDVACFGHGEPVTDASHRFRQVAEKLIG